MVVPVSRKPNYAHKRLQAKLDHLLHHHQKPEAESELVSFRAKLSDGLGGLIEDLKVQVSFSWVEQGLRLVHGLNSAFNSLIEAVDYPMSKWGSALADEYFNYTLHLLDLSNSISSSLARLQTVGLSLAHALTSPTGLVKSAHPHNHDHRPARSWANEEESGKGNLGESGSCHGTEKMVLEAVEEMQGVALWVCRVVLCGLGGEMISKDSEVMNRMGHEIPLLVGADSRSRVYGELAEVKEVNEMVAGLLLLAAPPPLMGEEAKEMQSKVERFQSKLEEAVREVNCLFSEALASRDRLMDCFRLNKQ